MRNLDLALIGKCAIGAPVDARMNIPRGWPNWTVARRRELFAKLLACRNSNGVLAQHIDPCSGEPWKTSYKSTAWSG